MRVFCRPEAYVLNIPTQKLNMSLPYSFPLRGVIGVVANSATELDQAVSKQLQCVEIRADLLLDQGMKLDAVMDIVRKTASLRLGCLVTLRHPTHGGKFTGTEAQRVDINRQALAAGADIIDLEWDTEAAATLLKEGAPLILSYHNFEGMPDDRELADLTHRMELLKPLAIKVVPTASKLEDAYRMLHWAEQGTEHSPQRIGFAMGSAGSCSRILTTVFGGAVTYASFGDAVAPGQIALDAMLDEYRLMHVDQKTQVAAVVGDVVFSAAKTLELNRLFASDKSNRVAVAFAAGDKSMLEELRQPLRVAEIVTD